MAAEEPPKMEDLSLSNGKPSPDEDVVDPWNVVGSADTGIDYEKLISKL